MHRGQPMGKRYLFDEPLEIACLAAGLVDGDGHPAVSAHRFRHTVGTQLAEGGAQIQTIMAILGHSSATMAATYSHISDPVLKEQYEKVIAAGGRIAGPAAEALLANQMDQDTLDSLKANFFKTELELGHCLRTPAEGPCECDLYLRCPKFFTTSEYAPRLRPPPSRTAPDPRRHRTRLAPRNRTPHRDLQPHLRTPHRTRRTRPAWGRRALTTHIHRLGCWRSLDLPLGGRRDPPGAGAARCRACPLHARSAGHPGYPAITSRQPADRADLWLGSSQHRR